ncbi:MAG: hypothetical protein OXH46_05600 [Gemmatimonadetes bacterium]|nr:hypothetical protein [Gemmatimonadota bacterium]
MSELLGLLRALGVDGFQSILTRIDERAGEPFAEELDGDGNVLVEGQRTRDELMAKFVAPGDEGLSTRIFQATADRPEGYPDDLPFLSGTNMMTCLASASIHQSGVRVALWTGERDAGETLKAVVTESSKIGWAVASQSGLVTRMVSGDRERIVSYLPTGTGTPTVMLFEQT